MQLSVIGCGYLGAVHAAATAPIGHQVVGIDVDARKTKALAQGQAPFFEPGLQDVLTEGVASRRLTFTTDMAGARGAKVNFVCVGPVPVPYDNTRRARFATRYQALRAVANPLVGILHGCLRHPALCDETNVWHTTTTPVEPLAASHVSPVGSLDTLTGRATR